MAYSLCMEANRTARFIEVASISFEPPNKRRNRDAKNIKWVAPLYGANTVETFYWLNEYR